MIKCEELPLELSKQVEYKMYEVIQNEVNIRGKSPSATYQTTAVVKDNLYKALAKVTTMISVNPKTFPDLVEAVEKSHFGYNGKLTVYLSEEVKEDEILVLPEELAYSFLMGRDKGFVTLEEIYFS